MNKLEQAARQALEALEVSTDWDIGAKGKQLESMRAITALREALAEQEKPLYRKVLREMLDAHEQAEQEPFDMDEHPPHRLCECRKCMEYFTPLPDCDAFAAFGKPIAEQTNTQLMEGFRPVSEMIAEHKQDPKKAAAIEKAKMRKAEQEPVAWHEPNAYGNVTTHRDWANANGWLPLYASPVRTKDLTDDEIDDVRDKTWCLNNSLRKFARAVIAAYKEKNK